MAKNPANGAYFGKKKLKKKIVKRANAHVEAGTVVQRQYGGWEVLSPGTAKFKGCFIGCTLQPEKFITIHDGFTTDNGAWNWAVNNDVPNPQADMNEDNENLHEKIQEKLNFSVAFVMVAECIFEGLSPSEAKYWPKNVLEAIPVGADLGEDSVFELIQDNAEVADTLTWAGDTIGTPDGYDYITHYAYEHGEDHNNSDLAAEAVINWLKYHVPVIEKQ